MVTLNRLKEVLIKAIEGVLEVEGIVINYIARDAETKSKFFVVHRPKGNWDHYDSFRLHIGTEVGLMEAQVQHVERAINGVTINIDYFLAGVQGRLHFPTPFDKEAKPTDTYNGKIVELETLL